MSVCYASSPVRPSRSEVPLSLLSLQQGLLPGALFKHPMQEAAYVSPALLVLSC